MTHEQPDKGEGWRPIAEHDGGHDLYDLAWFYVPSAFAAMNGAREMWCYAEGRKIYDGCFTGILGSKPSHFRPLSGELTS